MGQEKGNPWGVAALSDCDDFFAYSRTPPNSEGHPLLYLRNEIANGYVHASPLLALTPPITGKTIARTAFLLPWMRRLPIIAQEVGLLNEWRYRLKYQERLTGEP